MATDGPGGSFADITEEECLEILTSECGRDESYDYCSNDAGECEVGEEDYYWCYCYDGHYEGGGSDSTEPYPGEDSDEEEAPPPSEPEGFLRNETACEQKLVEVCGTEAPDLKKICSEEALPYCVNILDVYFEKCDEKLSDEIINDLTNGEWNEYGIGIAECCKIYDDDPETKSFYDDFLECLETKTCDECEDEFEEYLEDEMAPGGTVGDDYGDSGDTGDSNDDANSGDKGAVTQEDDDSPGESSGSSTSSGCSVLTI